MNGKSILIYASVIAMISGCGDAGHEADSGISTAEGEVAGIPACTANQVLTVQIAPSCTDAWCKNVQVRYNNTGPRCQGVGTLQIESYTLDEALIVPSGSFWWTWEFKVISRPVTYKACPIGGGTACVTKVVPAR